MWKAVEWIMKIKIKYVIILVMLFVSCLVVLHITNSYEDEIIIDSQRNYIKQESHADGISDHVPDYVLEEEALPMTDTMEELDGRCYSYNTILKD